MEDTHELNKDAWIFFWGMHHCFHSVSCGPDGMLTRSLLHFHDHPQFVALLQYIVAVKMGYHLLQPIHATLPGEHMVFHLATFPESAKKRKYVSTWSNGLVMIIAKTQRCLMRTQKVLLISTTKS